MNRRFIAILSALFFLTLTGCNSGSGSSTGTGSLKVSLTDAASPGYKAVYISINQVEVKVSTDGGDTGWQLIDVVDKTVNLLDLTGGTLESLGIRTLAAGDYNQVRLKLATAPDGSTNILNTAHPFANYVIETDNTVHELKVPSGYQTGIKLVKRFTIAVEGLTELILDFDATKSVVKAGNSGTWILKPVIHVLDTVTLAGIQGAVTDTPAPGTALEGAWVAAQSYDAAALDPKDEVTVHAATLTDDFGAYLLRVLAGNYTIVAVKGGFAPECSIVTATSGITLTEDFALTAAASGTLSVTVSGLAAVDDSVTVSVRMESTCGGTSPRLVEIASHAFAENATFPIILPEGTYTVVAYGDNLTTLSETKVITSGGTTTMAVSL